MSVYRFGIFELDTARGELRRQGVRVKLQEKPFEALVLLLEHAGEIVSREQFRERLWLAGTFVDFDLNLNAAIKRVRECLGDDAGIPHFVETVPRRGYRFLYPVEKAEPSPVNIEPPRLSDPRRFRAVTLVAAIVVAALLGTGLALLHSHRGVANPTLAVMPFHGGITGELLVQIGRLAPEKLSVTDEAGSRRGVRYLLEGSESFWRDRLRASARLMRASDRVVIWAETYDRSSEDQVAAEREIARRVSQAIALELLPANAPALARAATLNSQAYDAYMQGLTQCSRLRREGYEEAVRWFREAIRLDPDYAVAWDGLATTYIAQADSHSRPREEALADADRAAAKAQEIDPSVPYSCALRACVLRRAHPKSPEIDGAYRYALERNSAFSSLHLDYAQYLECAHRGPDAVAELSRAVELNPGSTPARTQLARLLRTSTVH